MGHALGQAKSQVPNGATVTGTNCSEIYVADEVFFTGTAAEVTPVRELDGRQIGSGTRGPVTQMLQAKYFDCVQGRDSQHDDWLTFV